MLPNEIVSTDWTPKTVPNKLYTSEIIIGWLICHLSVLKKSFISAIQLSITSSLL